MGDPQDPDVNFGPMVSERQTRDRRRLYRQGQGRGRASDHRRQPRGRAGLFPEPTVFADVTDDMTIAREEIFGPVMSVLDFDTEDEVIARANDTEFGLAAGVFTADLTRAHRVVAGFEAGHLLHQHLQSGPGRGAVWRLKTSGVGRENSKAAIEHYSQIKGVYVAMDDVEAPF